MRTLINILLILLLVTSCGTRRHKVKYTPNSGGNFNKELRKRERQKRKEQREYEKLLKKNETDFNKDSVSYYEEVYPNLDTDGDGIFDYEDKCPTVFGIPENMGCPEISMEVKEAPKQLMVEFEYVLVSSFEDMLEKNPKIVPLEDYWPEYYYHLKENFVPIRHNIDLVNTLFYSGCLSKDQYENYIERVNKGEVFDLKWEEPETYIYGVLADGKTKKNLTNYIPNIENMDIVDNTDNKNSSKGTIAYSVPEEMQVGKSYVIKLRITKEKGKEVNKTLVLGDREIPISDVNVKSKITIENIRVEKTMTAKLISDDGTFKVTPQNTEKQVIEDDEYTEWGWVVSPLKSGKTYLKLVIKIRIVVDGETSYKDIVVFDKDIEVKSNLKHGVGNWVSQYWEWLISTIIIPLVIFFYKRREKKKEG